MATKVEVGRKLQRESQRFDKTLKKMSKVKKYLTSSFSFLLEILKDQGFLSKKKEKKPQTSLFKYPLWDEEELPSRLSASILGSETFPSAKEAAGSCFCLMRTCRKLWAD